VSGSPRVSGLRISPVKALASVSVSRIRLSRDGVAEDRRLFLLREDGSVATMRRFPRLAGVVPDLDLAEGRLGLTFPGGRSAVADLTALGEPVEAVLFGKEREGRVVEGSASAALSEYAGEPLRLVLSTSTGVGWDEGPVSLVGHASARVVGAPNDPDGPDLARYRMLVELDGTEPFEEDAWAGRVIELGSARVRVTHALVRCVVIEHHGSTGARDWDGLKTLARVRGRSNLTLGMIGEVDLPGTISVGDHVAVPG